MQLSAVVLTLAMSTTSAPPEYGITADHSQPMHWTQPTIRVFEEHEMDYSRRTAWNDYVRELDRLWADYRAAGSTPRAFETYKREAAQAKRRYVVGDPWLMPIVDPRYFMP